MILIKKTMILGILGITLMLAQGFSKSGIHYHGLTVGAVYQDNAGVRWGLKDLGYHGMNNVAATVGGDFGAFFFERMLVGFDIHGMFSKVEVVEDTKESKINGFYGGVKLGLNTLSSERFYLIPTVGLGGQATYFHLTDSRTKDFGGLGGFDETKFRYLSYYVSGELKFMFTAPNKRHRQKHPDSTRFKGVGLNVGGRYHFRDKWKAQNNIELSGTPNISKWAVYAEVVFLGGAKMKKYQKK